MILLRVGIGVSILCSSARAQYSFVDLGLPDPVGKSALRGLSGYGTVAVGAFPYFDGHGKPISVADGQVSYLRLGEYGNGIAYDVSLDGRFVVGEVSTFTNTGPEFAAIWKDGKLRVLEREPGGGRAVAFGVSSDGRVAVGSSNASTHVTQAARWVDGAVFPLGNLPDSSGLSSAHAVSADGSVVVGFANSEIGKSRAFRWEAGVMAALPTTADVSASDALDISGNGARIVGYAEHPRLNRDALLWENGVALNLGRLPGGDSAVASAISADDQVVAGWSATANDNQVFIWDALNGMRELRQLLSDEGVDLNGWTRLTEVRDISDDGTTLLGYGYNARGFYSPFIATIPEPHTLALATMSIGLFSGSYRRRGTHGL